MQSVLAQHTTTTVTETETHATTRTRNITTTPVTTSSPAATQATSITVATPEAYDSAPAIDRWYVSDCERWYQQQPQHNRADGQYQKAMKLRLKYPKCNHEWALTRDRIGHYVKAANGRMMRDWSEQEVNAYIDFQLKKEKQI